MKRAVQCDINLNSAMLFILGVGSCILLSELKGIHLELLLSDFAF